MPACVVNWCRSHTRSGKCLGITFHYFPVEPVRKKKWIAAVRLERQENSWMPVKTSRVCSIHFEENDFYKSIKGYTMLHKTAVPVCTMIRPAKKSSSLRDTRAIEKLYNNQRLKLVDISKLLNKTNTADPQAHKAQKRKLENNIDTKFNEDIEVELNNTKFINNLASTEVYWFEDRVCVTPLNKPSSDVESALNTSKTHMLQQRLRNKSILSEKRLSQIRNPDNRNKIVTMKYISLKNILSQLKENGFGDTAKNTALNEFSDDVVLALTKKKSKQGRSIIKFTPVIKKFALTLYYYSPAGYKCVRRQLLSFLPHPSILSKWYQSTDGKPGFTDEAFAALKLKYSKSDKRLACLIVDEMAIRQQKIFNGQSIDGLVTFGPSDEMATQVYVLMLVALNDTFKLPLGYFFVNGLAAEQRANILKMCLEKCHDVGAEVVTLTFDGCASNIATAKILGCNFEDASNLKTFFDHPSTEHPVVIILDPCHMVKLVLNTLEEKKTLLDVNKKKIEWAHLQKLKNIQDNIELHFGNKLSSRDIEFRNNIMNVKLATQTLSQSVADVIKFCSQQLNMPDFQDTDATVSFLEIFKNLSDVLNSKSLSGHGLKQPFLAGQKENLYNVLNQSEKYIKSLQINIQSKKTRIVNGQRVIDYTNCLKPVTKTQSKTGFLGLLVCISSFKLLFLRLVEAQILKFILPYKFSQDHIELFFGEIRNHSCHNNTNAQQFMRLYKKTLLNLNLSSKFSGNSITLEDIPILNCFLVINRTTPGFRYKTESDSNYITTEGDNRIEKENCMVLSNMLDSSLQMPETVKQILGYMAGFVTRKLQAKITCSECLSQLPANERLYFHKLIALKDFGGLSYPSVVLFKICTRTETLLRQIIKINNNGKSLTRASNLSIITTQCFSKLIDNEDILRPLRKSHQTNNDHYIFLIKCIIVEFLTIRLHYIAKKDTLLISSRHKLSKLNIFRCK